MTVLLLGDRAIRFPRPARSDARALLAAIQAWPGIVDVVITHDHIAAYFDGPLRVPAQGIESLAALTSHPTEPREHALTATYDGEDLAYVADACELTVREVIRLHGEATYVVDTIGFQPGFAYLTGLDPRLQLPRRATPRARAPAGALAIAEAFTAVYPFAGPGGWHLIGSVAAPMFSDAGAVLALGDRVRFTR